MAKLKPNQFIIDGHTITEIPLLFQTEMVQAVLEDRKTQTRRGIKGLPLDRLINLDFAPHLVADPGNHIGPYGKPGDLLWVRETWAKNHDVIAYKADYEEKEDQNIAGNIFLGWKPSIHMPKAACRIWLMVEEIRVERLQDITDKDAKAEGAKNYMKMSEFSLLGELGDWVIPKPFLQHQFGFLSIWVQINGPESWLQNPWVWVVKFRVLSKTGRPSDEVIADNYKQITHA